MLPVFAFIVGLQLLVTVISIDLLSAVRSYVTGESLYSKGQKDAQLHLIEYIDDHDEKDYERFLESLAIPIGYRVARQELQRQHPDFSVVRRGLLGIGFHPDDIGGAIWLFRWFHTTPLMADAIAVWTEGDRVIDQMREVGERGHERIVAGDPQAPVVTEMRQTARALNKTLTELEIRFSKKMTDGARLAQRLLLGLNFTIAALLGISGLAFVRHSAQVQAATEDEVRRRQESLQRLLDSTAEGLFGTDTQGRCTFINRAALDMLGYDNEEALLGRDMHATVRRIRTERGSRRAAANGLPRPDGEWGDVHVVDTAFWRRDGSSFPVEFWSHSMVEGDLLHGAVTTFFDISDRLSMQAALRQGEVRIAALVDAVNDGVVTIDADDRIVLFNRAAERMFGVPAKDAMESKVGRFIPPDAMTAGNRAGGWQHSDPTPEAVRELIGKRADGQEFPLEVSVSRLESERGALVTAVLRDATSLQTARAEQQAREALEASSRAKTEFLSRMSHELRTPLNAVLGFSQLLRLDNLEPPSRRQLERVQHIESAGAHLLALVNDVLDLSRVESGQLTVTLEAVDLRVAIEEAVSMVAPLALSFGVEHRIVGPRGAATATAAERSLEAGVSVLADRVRLRQVLVNLLSNAIKYNRRGGKVWVSWAIERGKCDLRITDDGIGMSPAQLGRLFEPFNRLGAEKSKIEGTGIGLMLSRRLAEVMQGELRIDSAVGRGTEVSLELVCTTRPPLRPRLSSPPSQHGELDQPLHVLYAEDNEVNAEIVRQIVRLRPSIVFDVAESGEAALLKARRDPPQLMLVDMNLGDMTGIELARALHADPVTAPIRLVALSADALPEQIDAALAVGFEAYLTKPIDFRKLLGVLDEHLTQVTAV